ncbi:MAG: MATE family efflux transporter [Candidatus Protochlamydia sp.]|nr:MATE family efflux transporter [Candidatus Protochlamydia sp.]
MITNDSSSLVSMRKLWAIALPLMLSSLSAMVMMFIDRLILAHYSMDAHNAAVEAGNMGWSFLAGWMALNGAAQIFVAQNYGAGKYKQLGQPIWQMMWLGLASLVFFYGLMKICPSYFFGGDASCEVQRTYLKLMLIFCPFHGLFNALNGFFIGQGKTFLPTTVVLLGNLINGICCYLLVFGYGDVIPSFGAKGAAIAMNIAVIGQVSILLLSFLSSKNRRTCGTADWKWNPKLFKTCIFIGTPQALFCFLEVAGWGVFYKMMATLGESHLTVAGIVQNLLILCMFFADGLSRAIAALAGNAIGAKRFDIVFKIVQTGFKAMVIFAIGFAGILWFTHNLIIDQFLSSMSAEQRELLYPALVFGFANAVIYKFLEGIRMVVAGALTAAADTFFLLVAGTCSIWFFMVIPVYLFVTRAEGSIETALVICTIYTLLSAVVYTTRFYQGSWQKGGSLVLEAANN